MHVFIYTHTLFLTDEKFGLNFLHIYNVKIKFWFYN